MGLLFFGHTLLFLFNYLSQPKVYKSGQMSYLATLWLRALWTCLRPVVIVNLWYNHTTYQCLMFPWWQLSIFPTCLWVVFSQCGCVCLWFGHLFFAMTSVIVSTRYWIERSVPLLFVLHLILWFCRCLRGILLGTTVLLTFSAYFGSFCFWFHILISYC